MKEALIWYAADIVLPENRQKVLFRLDDGTIKSAIFVKSYSNEHIEVENIFKSDDKGFYVLFTGQEDTKMKGYKITHWCAYPTFTGLKTDPK